MPEHPPALRPPGGPQHGPEHTPKTLLSAVRRRVLAFAGFWCDFIVGDDWLVAAGVAAGLALTFVLSRSAVAAWWLMPAAVAVLLPLSLWRLTRRRGR